MEFALLLKSMIRPTESAMLHAKLMKSGTQLSEPADVFLDTT